MKLPYDLVKALENRLGGPIMASRRVIIALVQLISVALSNWMAYQLRFDFAVNHTEWERYLNTLGLLLLCRLIFFWYFRMLSGMWRHTSFSDVMDIMKACLAGSAMFLATMWLWKGHSLGGLSRSIVAMEPVLTFLMMVGLRAAVRAYREYLHTPARQRPTRRTLVVGAGDRAIMAARFMLADNQLGLSLVGFLDDDHHRRNLMILGRPVLGKIQSLPDLLVKRDIDLVLVSLPDAPFRKIKEIEDICAAKRVNCRILRSPEEILSEHRNLVRIQEITPTGVMRRDMVSFAEEDRSGPETDRSGKVVLVSGAAGSIGSELCRQIATQDPELLVLLDQDESGLYDINQELQRRAPRLKTREVLCDIANRTKLEHVFRRYAPHEVFHAAAYKHVPMMEYEPVEAIRVNVLGSYNLGSVARDHGVQKFVLISTDKAVNPVNIMGMSKFMAERLLLSLNGLDGTRYMAVRFGNVINSNGSVVPLFRRQVEEGGPVTVTHKDITRFFMAIEEAAKLVLAAGEMGRGGEIFLLDMGKPVRIMDVAKHVIALAGLEPEKDIEIRITGLRPGEKLHEELFWEGEGISKTAHPCINRTSCTPMTTPDIEVWLKRCRSLLDDWEGRRVRSLLTQFIEAESRTTTCGDSGIFDPLSEEKSPGQSLNVL